MACLLPDLVERLHAGEAFRVAVFRSVRADQGHEHNVSNFTKGAESSGSHSGSGRRAHALISSKNVSSAGSSQCCSVAVLCPPRRPAIVFVLNRSVVDLHACSRRSVKTLFAGLTAQIFASADAREWGMAGKRHFKRTHVRKHRTQCVARRAINKRPQ